MNLPSIAQVLNDAADAPALRESLAQVQAECEQAKADLAKARTLIDKLELDVAFYQELSRDAAAKLVKITRALNG